MKRFKGLHKFIAYRNAYIHHPYQFDIFPGAERDDTRFRLWNYSNRPLFHRPKTSNYGLSVPYNSLDKTRWSQFCV